MIDPPIADPLTPRRAIRHCRVAVGLCLGAAAHHVVVLGLLAIVSGLAPVAAAWLLKLVIDWLADGTPGTLLVWLAVAMAVLGVAAAVLPRISSYAEAELGRAVRLAAFAQIFGTVNERLRGLSKLEDPRFHDRLRLAESAGTSAPGRVVHGGVALAQAALTLVGFLITLVVINPWLALAVALAAVPTIRAEARLARRRVGAMWRIEHAERRRFFYSGLLSSPRDAKEVRLFGLGGFFRGRMLTELRDANHTQRALDRRELIVQAVLAFLGAVIAGAGLVWAIAAARRGDITIGDISVFVAAVAGVQGGLSAMVGQIGLLHQALLMLDHYQAVVGVQQDLEIATESAPTPTLRHRIELHDVWFRYGPERQWVLRGVDLQIPASRSLALVGLNGAGKSTLVKLICRLYDPTHGRITWDGIDLRDFDTDELRRRIGIVFQDYVEYDLSAAENIGVGDLAGLDDRDRIHTAAEHAGIHDTLRALPKGYDTLLTRMYMSNADRDDPETGVLLSGGQGQRLALARTFMRQDCDLLILDEPSAGLDAEAEAEIHRQICRHRQARTSLLISHRLNTVRDADRIVVLADGLITESGDHASLMAYGGEYARLFGLQAAGYAEPAEFRQ